MRRHKDSRASLAYWPRGVPIQKQAKQTKICASSSASATSGHSLIYVSVPECWSVLIQKFDAGFVRPDPSDLAVKAQHLAFHFEHDFLVVFQTLCLGRNAAAACTDVFNDTGLMRILKFQDSRPFATLAREDPGLLQ